MNLSAMTISDLQQLQAALVHIHEAATILSKLPDCGEGGLVVQMRPGEPVAVVTSWLMPTAGSVPKVEPVVIEDLPVAAVSEPAAPVAVVSVSDTSKAALREAVQIKRASVKLDEGSNLVLARAHGAPPRAKAVRKQNPPAGRVSGPLTESERKIILSRCDMDSPASIALDLNRRVQDVSLFLHRLHAQKSRSSNGIDRTAPTAAVTTGGPEASHTAPHTGHTPAAAQVDACAATLPETAALSDEDAQAAAIPRAVVEIVPPAPPPSSAILGQPDPRPERQLAIGQMVDRLRAREGFDAEVDLEIVEALAKGVKVAEVALDFGLDTAAVKARWADMTARLLDAKGHLRIEDQKFLIVELRRKVREARSREA